MPPSTLQLPVWSADGALLGRADSGWQEQRVIGEFDGRAKYGRPLRPGQPGDVVFAEKRREDAFREQGWGVVRWTWGDLAPRDRGRGPGPSSARPEPPPAGVTPD
ncbi:hypothetical protein [Geodermatophilus sabuli]|uniref:hypothetical protein n=1 Tax=Geodermatophilus sabuli TaxID=1564158 RepID=UPI001952D351|nr:hypothetical protein [Geodermatophilus sabuli]